MGMAMRNSIITACPTMANPEAFDNIEELRLELHRANDNVLRLTDQLHEERYVLQSVSESLAGVVLCNIAGEQDAVKRKLDEIVAKHVKIVRKPEGAVH